MAFQCKAESVSRLFELRILPSASIISTATWPLPGLSTSQKNSPVRRYRMDSSHCCEMDGLSDSPFLMCVQYSRPLNAPAPFNNISAAKYQNPSRVSSL